MFTNKIKILFLLSALGASAHAHSQMPTVYGGKNAKLDSISLKQIKNVPIYVMNLNKYRQKYSISINGKKVGETNFVSSKKEIKINVPVKIETANKLERYDICTTSISEEKVLFNTQICTKAFLYWNKEE